MKSRLVIPLIASGLLFAAAAIGQNDTLLSSARELAKEGLEAYDSGRYEEAAEKLTKAYQLVPVPTLATNRARALVKLGKWVSAAERYLEAIRIARDKTWQAVQVEAQRDAERERDALMPRIPRVKVMLTGAGPSDVEVSVDGVVLPAALIGVEQLQDPGVHKVQAKRGAELVSESFTAKEGAHAIVTLRFKSGQASQPQPGLEVPHQPEKSTPVAQASQATQPEPSSNVGNEAGSSNHQKLIGWIGVGAGGAGILLGGITGVLALSKHSSLNDSPDCSSELQNCTPSKRNDVEAYNSLLPITTIGFIAGGVLTAAGVTLLLTAPTREAGPRVGLWVSPSGASVTGRF